MPAAEQGRPDAAGTQRAAPPGPPLPSPQRYPPPPAAEPHWPAQLTVLVAIALQVVLPERLTAGPTWVLPTLEGILLVGLFFATPHHIAHVHVLRRRSALALVGLASAANVYSLAELVHFLLHRNVTSGRQLIIAGTLIWLTNFLLFALWYWELDRGGPGHRAAGADNDPDFLFPQMNDDAIQPRGWRPRFVDYLYLSLTNATAFSPTDTMPLSAQAKLMMGLQSLVSLITIGLIISRAVNIL